MNKISFLKSDSDMDRTEELMNLKSVEWEKFEEIKEWLSL